MQMAALSRKDPAAFFDLSAACPSLEHGCLHRVMEELRVPAPLRWTVRALHAEQRCCLALGGGLWPGFGIMAGIRQSWPLSPLLFGFVLEPLLRGLGRLSRRSGCRAFVGDIELVVEGGPPSWRAVWGRFAELAPAAGLRLNFPVSVLIPLWDWRQSTAESRWRAAAPKSASMRVAYSIMYLGFEVGFAGGGRLAVPCK